jgi:hypothetical protein
MGLRGIQGILLCCCMQATTAGCGGRRMRGRDGRGVRYYGCFALAEFEWGLGSLAEVESLARANTAATMLAGLGANGFTGVTSDPATTGGGGELE